MKILIVDDKKENLFLLEQTLRTSGYEIVTANDGAEALNILHVQSCDLIISDILMPVMDGYQLCKKVKEDNQLRAIPFIFYTATYTDKKDEEFALALGADKFIRKPMEPEEFLQIIQERTSDLTKVNREGTPQKSPLLEEKEILKLYSERLVNKLEKKMVDLEREMRERKRAEEKQAELVRMLNASLNELYVFDAETFRFIEVNRGAQENLKYSMEELFLLTPLDLMTELTQESFMRLLEPLRAAEQQRIQFSTVHRRKDGSLYPVEVYLERSTLESLSVFMAIALDISERKRAEEAFRRIETQLHQLQKMEALGTLSAGIAHDFNNILGAILGYTELALIKVSPQGEVHQTLQQVLKAGNRAKELVKHILTFSRQVEQKRKPTQLHSVVTEALTLLRATLPSTIAIHDHISVEAGIVLADPTQIHQVLMNLGTNAEHAMREKGGVLEVRLDTAKISDQHVAMHPEFKAGPYLRLSVHDTGHGISPEIQNRIFEPFFTTKSIGEGTGMGLSVVHGIITNHDGVITADSSPGNGTTFVIYLPRIDATIAPDVRESMPSQPRRACVMFVDDEEPLAQLGHKMLQELGHEAIVCSGSVAALQAFRQNPNRYDVVITDQTMPNLTGEALTRELLQIRPNIPIILCTGFSSTLTPEKAHTLGIQDYLMKPILIKELAVALKKALGQPPK